MKTLVIITGSNGAIGSELKLQYFKEKNFLVMGIDLKSENSLKDEHYFLRVNFSKKFTDSVQTKIE
jgi:FlaA1/EpsC-like NDP-sugar epimerase